MRRRGWRCAHVSGRGAHEPLLSPIAPPVHKPLLRPASAVTPPVPGASNAPGGSLLRALNFHQPGNPRALNSSRYQLINCELITLSQLITLSTQPNPPLAPTQVVATLRRVAHDTMPDAYELITPPARGASTTAGGGLLHGSGSSDSLVGMGMGPGGSGGSGHEGVTPPRTPPPAGGAAAAQPAPPGSPSGRPPYTLREGACCERSGSLQGAGMLPCLSTLAVACAVQLSHQLCILPARPSPPHPMRARARVTLTHFYLPPTKNPFHL